MLATIRHVDNYSETQCDCNTRVALHRDNIRGDRLCAEHTKGIRINVNRTFAKEVHYFDKHNALKISYLNFIKSQK